MYLKLDEEKIFCWSCNLAVIQYYHEMEKVERGRCPRCRIDFPLEGESSISKIMQMRFVYEDPFSFSKEHTHQ